MGVCLSRPLQCCGVWNRRSRFFLSGGWLVELALARRKDSIEGGGAREPQVSTPFSIGGEHVNM